MSDWYRSYAVLLSGVTPLYLWFNFPSLSKIGRWYRQYWFYTWWRHQMEIFSALLALCAGNSPVTGEFPAQRPMTRSFDVVFYPRLNKRLSKQAWGWWFETQSRPLWRHCNDNVFSHWLIPCSLIDINQALVMFTPMSDPKMGNLATVAICVHCVGYIDDFLACCLHPSGYIIH